MKLRQHPEEGSLRREAVLGVLANRGFRVCHVGDDVVEIEIGNYVEHWDLPPVIGSRMIERIVRLTGIPITDFYYKKKLN